MINLTINGLAVQAPERTNVKRKKETKVLHNKLFMITFAEV